MRPSLLDPLFASVENLKGVGPRLAKLFQTLAGPRVIDLCWHLPSGLIDRRYSPKLAQAEVGRVATLILRVAEHRPPAVKRRPYRVHCLDDSGSIDLVFFHARPEHLERVLPTGEVRVVGGKLEWFQEGLQMTHPDHIGALETLSELKRVEPVYRLTAGLTSKVVGKAITAALERTVDLPEWQDQSLLKQRGWQSWQASLRAAHRPGETQDLEPDHPARARLAYDELLANQLALSLIRRQQRSQRGRITRGDGRLRGLVSAALPFRLTAGQQQAIDEILADMAGEGRMLRLLQGDVGSGKTLVALMAMLAAAEAGGQAALMAPTEILARQHWQTIEPLAAAAGLRCELLTGRDKGRARGEAVDRLAEGESAIAIGTHALFQQDVRFQNLRLAVIDEQHRFGVHQRLSLTGKGSAVDILVMTATPIPRTLLLTAYGDMAVSRLMEKPAGRRAVDTRTLPLDRLAEVVDAVGRRIAYGAKVFWVCPLVEESEVVDLAAAEERFAELCNRYPGRVGLVHGRMKTVEKDRTMQAFAAGPLQILVATTVVEVGVDVPDASVMVIEHAERFGLAQLHQLRGRVGRGQAQAFCLLLYAAPLGGTARKRLEAMCDSNDGFHIAEEDLRLRGPGEVLGTRQSGLPNFRLADLAAHGDLLAVAKDEAKLILEKGERIEPERWEALRLLLYLFERDAAVRYLQSG